jgi:hypothetical protein
MSNLLQETKFVFLRVDCAAIDGHDRMVGKEGGEWNRFSSIEVRGFSLGMWAWEGGSCRRCLQSL